MCCGHHRHYHGDCWDDAIAWGARGARQWGTGYGPPPWAGSGYGWEFGPVWWQPSASERKEQLETFKKHLEARLASVNEELGKQ